MFVSLVKLKNEFVNCGLCEGGAVPVVDYVLSDSANDVDVAFTITVGVHKVKIIINSGQLSPKLLFNGVSLK